MKETEKKSNMTASDAVQVKHASATEHAQAHIRKVMHLSHSTDVITLCRCMCAHAGADPPHPLLFPKGMSALSLTNLSGRLHLTRLLGVGSPQACALQAPDDCTANLIRVETCRNEAIISLILYRSK